MIFLASYNNHGLYIIHHSNGKILALYTVHSDVNANVIDAYDFVRIMTVNLNCFF